MVTINSRCPHCHNDGIAVNLNEGLHFLCGNCLSSWHLNVHDLYDISKLFGNAFDFLALDMDDYNTILEVLFEDVSGQTVQAPENYDIGALGLDPSGTYPISGEF